MEGNADNTKHCNEAQDGVASLLYCHYSNHNPVHTNLPCPRSSRHSVTRRKQQQLVHFFHCRHFWLGASQSLQMVQIQFVDHRSRPQSYSMPSSSMVYIGIDDQTAEEQRKTRNASLFKQPAGYSQASPKLWPNNFDFNCYVGRFLGKSISTSIFNQFLSFRSLNFHKVFSPVWTQFTLLMSTPLFTWIWPMSWICWVWSIVSLPSHPMHSCAANTARH